MRIFAWSAIGLIGLCACDAKDRERGTEAGGASGSAQGGSAQGGSAGDASGGSAAGGSGGSSAAGNTTGGSGGSSAGSTAGGAGGVGGTGGSGGRELSCTPGPVYTVPTGSIGTQEPSIALATCADATYIVASLETGLLINLVRLDVDGNPLEHSWTYDQVPYRVRGATCDANQLKVLTTSARGFEEFSFNRSGRDLVTPLAPDQQLLETPSPCQEPNGHFSNVVASYNGGLHAAFDCQSGNNAAVYVGWPPIAVESGPSGDGHLRVDAYAFAGGMHFLTNYRGDGWVGTNAGQLNFRQLLNFEDPLTRPVAGMLLGATSSGFHVFGLTTNPPPTVLPGRAFAGTVLPSEVNKLFVGGGGPPASVKLQREFNNPDEFGSTTSPSTGALTTFFSFVNLSEDVRATIVAADGSMLSWATPVYTPVDATVRRAYSTHDDKISYGVVWTEYDGQGVYVVKGRNMKCL